MRYALYFLVALLLSFHLLRAQSQTSIQTLSDFSMQASLLVNENGAQLSDPSYRPPVHWFPVKVPTTVLSGLVANKVYPNPYDGMNNMFIPDASDEFNKQYQLERYSHLPGVGNPWKKPYWFRTTFDVPGAANNKSHHLVFKGINYRAEVWLNGKKVADSTQMAGMFAEYELNVTKLMKPGKTNGLAIKIYPLDYPGLPSQEQLKIFDDFYPNGGPTGDIGKNVTMLCSVGWDWMPPVRDRNMGIWQPVYLRTTGDLKINYPRVSTQLNSPDTTMAELTLDLAIENLSDKASSATLNVKLEPQNFIGQRISFSYPVNVNKPITNLKLTSQQVKVLQVKNPSLWWPLNYGKPNLYRVTVNVTTASGVSDEKIFQTGLRTATSTVTKTKNSVRRDFFVNGKKIHLVGGAWVPDMMLQNDSLRIARELQLVKNANMNLVRIWGGGVTPSDIFFDLCDRLGLLVWSDFWVTGDTQGEFKGSPDWPLEGNVFVKNVTSTIYRVRHHASLLVWTGGNEGHARKPLYDAMRDSVALIDGTRPFIPSSSGFAKLPEGWAGSWPDNQPSGVYSGGPYTWQDPKAYYDLTEKATDWVFKDETGIPSQPPYSTLSKIIPNLVWDKKAPFPFNDTWGYHDAATGNGHYELYYQEMVKRYGAPETMEEFSDKMQLMNAMGYQGIFEAPQSKLNETGGVMLWKLNPAFPSVIWQIYDWYMLPNAGYYFTRQSTAPVHAQFNRTTDFIDVVNRTYKSYENITVEADLFDINGKSLFTLKEKLKVLPSTSLAWKSAAAWKKNSGVQFLLLRVRDAQGGLLSQNTYWLETTNNFTSLNSMPKANIKASVVTDQKQNSKRQVRLQLHNDSQQLAFFSRVQLLDANGEEVLPSYWADNYFTLKAGEKRTLDVWVDEQAPAPKAARIYAWNANEVIVKLNK